MSFKAGDKVKIPTRKTAQVTSSDISTFLDKLRRLKVYPDFLIVTNVYSVDEIELGIKELGYNPRFKSVDLELFDEVAASAAEEKIKYRMCDFSSFSEGCGVKVTNHKGIFEGIAFMRGTTWYVATKSLCGDGGNEVPDEYKKDFQYCWKLGSQFDQGTYWSYGTIEVICSNTWHGTAGSDETRVLYNSIPLKKNLMENNDKFNQLLLIG